MTKEQHARWGLPWRLGDGLSRGKGYIMNCRDEAVARFPDLVLAQLIIDGANALTVEAAQSEPGDRSERGEKP